MEAGATVGVADREHHLSPPVSSGCSNNHFPDRSSSQRTLGGHCQSGLGVIMIGPCAGVRDPHGNGGCASLSASPCRLPHIARIVSNLIAGMGRRLIGRSDGVVVRERANHNAAANANDGAIPNVPKARHPPNRMATRSVATSKNPSESRGVSNFESCIVGSEERRSLLGVGDQFSSRRQALIILTAVRSAWQMELPTNVGVAVPLWLYPQTGLLELLPMCGGVVNGVRHRCGSAGFSVAGVASVWPSRVSTGCFSRSTF